MTLKRSSRALILIAVCAISLAAVQEGVLIRRQLKANAKETYKIESLTKITADTPAGSQEGSATSSSTLETTVGSVKPDGNSADFTILTTIDSMKMDGMMAAAPNQEKVPPVTVKGIIDTQNRLTETKAEGASGATNPMSMLGGSEASQMGLFVQFPAEAVKEGDTWTITLPANAMMGKDPQKLTAKFIGTRDFNGKQVYVVSVSGTMTIEPDMDAIKKASKGADPAMGMDLKIKGTAELDSENLIDPETGATLQATTHVKGKTDVEIVQMAMTTKVFTDSTVKMTKS